MGIHTVNIRLWRTTNENTAANILLSAISISIAGSSIHMPDEFPEITSEIKVITPKSIEEISG